MRRPTPRSTRTDTLFPYTTLFRAVLDVEGGFSWQRVVDACASLSLFATQRIIEVRMATSPDDEGRKTLQALAAQLQRDTLLIVVCGALDKRQREARSEERRVGKEWVSTCRYRGSPYH